MEREIILTMAEIKRIAEVFEQRPKDDFDVDIAMKFNAFMREKQESILNEIVSIREMRDAEYEQQKYYEWRDSLSDAEWNMLG